MKNIFIVNPVAGGRDVSDELARALSITAKEGGISQEDYAITRTTRVGHAREIAEADAKTGDRVRLFSVGGDGTLNEIINGAYPCKNAAVGCIPYGSGNDFLRNFGSKEEFLDLSDQLRGEELDIDLFQTNFGVGATICSAGLDAQIAHDIPRFRRMPLCGGETSYRLSILRNLMRPLGRTLNITMDNETITESCLMTTICNCGYYGGGFRAAPECAMDDGLLDVMVVRKVSLPRIAKILPVYQKGLHIRNGEVIPKVRDVISFSRCRSVTLEISDGKKEPIIITVDGECRPTRELTVEILPLAGRIVLPKRVFARHSGRS